MKSQDSNLIKTLIFSRDRALQLDATLRSFFLHCTDADNTQLLVLYKTSTHRHALQYQQLRGDYPSVNFVSEQNFRQDLLRIINPYSNHSRLSKTFNLLRRSQPFLARLLAGFIPKPHPMSFIFFLVDDILFLRKFGVFQAAYALYSNPDSVGFSFRLGRNTTYCYMHQTNQLLPNFSILSGQILKYNWFSANKDFGYPLEISSSLYRAEDMVPMLLGFKFDNPNLLEAGLARKKNKFKTTRPTLLCSDTSIAVCNPLNIVQTTFPNNRRGTQNQYTTSKLADMFDDGNRINAQAYVGLPTNSCHQEIELVFKKIGYM